MIHTRADPGVVPSEVTTGGLDPMPKSTSAWPARASAGRPVPSVPRLKAWNCPLDPLAEIPRDAVGEEAPGRSARGFSRGGGGEVGPPPPPRPRRRAGPHAADRSEPLHHLVRLSRALAEPTEVDPVQQIHETLLHLSSA